LPDVDIMYSSIKHVPVTLTMRPLSHYVAYFIVMMDRWKMHYVDMWTVLCIVSQAVWKGSCAVCLRNKMFLLHINIRITETFVCAKLVNFFINN